MVLIKNPFQVGRDVILNKVPAHWPYAHMPQTVSNLLYAEWATGGEGRTKMVIKGLFHMRDGPRYSGKEQRSDSNLLEYVQRAYGKNMAGEWRLGFLNPLLWWTGHLACHRPTYTRLCHLVPFLLAAVSTASVFGLAFVRVLLGSA